MVFVTLTITDSELLPSAVNQYQLKLCLSSQILVYIHKKAIKG
jgi:hypothetical protein